jgi:hypothetical protein
MAKTKDELEDMTKDELVNYADDNDIEVHHNWLKDEIISSILKAEKAAAKQEAKPAEKPEVKSAEPDDPTVHVDPELAALQRRANAPQDQPEEKEDD